MCLALVLVVAVWGSEESYPECALADDAEVAALAGSGVRPSELRVAASDRGLRRLAQSRVLRKVKRLTVCAEDVGIRALARSRQLRAVEDLEVIAHGEPLDADTVTALVASRRLRTVRRLRLTSSDSEAERTITGAAIDALIAHLDLPALRELDLSFTPMSDDQVIALVRAPWAAQLERLNLCETAISTAVVDAVIAERPRLTSLTELCLSGGIGGDVVAADYDRLAQAYGAGFRQHWDWSQ